MVSQHQSQTRKQTKEYSSLLACLSLLKSATLLRLGGRVGSPSFLARLTGQKGAHSLPGYGYQGTPPYTPGLASIPNHRGKRDCVWPWAFMDLG